MLRCINWTIFSYYIWGRSKFSTGFRVIPETDEAGPLFGKLASELQSNIAINDENVASGTLHYVTNYTEFSSKPAEQQGNYIALKVTDVSPEAVVTYKKVGSSARPVTLDQDRNIVIIVNDNSAVLRFTVTENGETTTKDISLANVTLEPASN